MSKTNGFDFCVLGAGSAGFAAATVAEASGKTVALVDSTQPLAGLCILRGCMPSKTLLRSAELAHLAKVGPRLGIVASGVRYDVPAIIERKRRIIGGFADDRVRGIEKFPLFRGSPRFTGSGELAVDDQVIRAKKFLIATGSLINRPEIDGLAETGYLVSDDILELESLPKSVIVLGGGTVAVELGQYLSRLGVATTIVQRGAMICSKEDPDVGRALRAALEKEGIVVVTGASLRRAEKTAAGKRVIADVSGQEVSFEGDEIFAALGRHPNVAGFGFEAAGVAFGPKGIEVDQYLRTTNPDIYAAGDVVLGHDELVHVAVYDGQLGAHNAFAILPKKADYDLQCARAVFTDPQVGIAGLTEWQCVERGIAYHKAIYPFDDLGKAITAELTEGFVKMLAKPDGRIIGVAIVGAEASDLIHEAIALIYFGAKVGDVLEMPHLHPTLAEIMTYPAEELCEVLDHEKHAIVGP